MTETQFGHVSTLGDHVRVLRRRKWVLFGTTALATGLAVFMSVRQSPMYEATAQVLIGQQNSAQSLVGPQSYRDPIRDGATQAVVAKSPAVAQLVSEMTQFKGHSPGELAAAMSVGPKTDADLLNFVAHHSDRETAVALANAFARQYLAFRSESNTRAIRDLRQRIGRRLEQLVASGQQRSQVYADLANRDQQLQIFEALQGNTASLVRGASGAAKTRPKPIRDGILGFILGAMLGVGVAFVWNALDTRIRAASEVGERLGLPLLARVPEPPRRLRVQRKLVMLEDPESPQAESFRMLRTNLEFVNLERGARSIMVTSAVEEEGKSTTVSNLAVALARTGKRVALVDLDLRRPMLARFFDLNGHPGLTDIALEHVGLDEALATIPISVNHDRSDGRPSFNGNVGIEGLLQVLPTGPLPPDAGEFMESRVVTQILRELQSQVDVVLIDAPPLLHVGDAMALTAKVDAVVLISRLNVLRRPMVTELRRLLTTSPAVALGFVLTGAGGEESYYAAGYYPYRLGRKDREAVG